MPPATPHANAYRTAPLRIALFYGGVFLFLGIMTAFWPVWLSGHGLSEPQIGLVQAIGTLSGVLMTPLAARWAERLGARKRPLVLLVLGAFVAYAAFRLAPGFWPIVAVTVVFFCLWGPVMPLTESLTMLTRERRPLEYGQVRLAGSVTFIVGAAGMGTVLSAAPDTWREDDLIHGAMLVAVGLTILAAWLLPDPRTPPATAARTPLRDLARQPGFLPMVSAATLIAVSHAAYYSFATLHWRAAGHTDAFIGFLWAEGVIAEIILFAFGATLVRRFGPERLIVLGGLAAALRWAAFGFISDPAILIAFQLLHALTFGAMHLGIIHYIAAHTPPEHSASAQGFFYMVHGLGMTLATAGAGYLYGAKPAAAFSAMAVLALIGALISTYICTQSQKYNFRN